MVKKTAMFLMAIGLAMACSINSILAAGPAIKPRRHAARPAAKRQQVPEARPEKTPAAKQAADAIDLARRTLAYVEKSAARPEMAAHLRDLAKRLTAAGADTQALAAVTDEIRALRRRIILSHPALDFERLLINQNPPTLYSHNCDQYLGRHSRPGPGLTVLESWKDNPRPTVLLAGKLPVGATWKPKLSWDAKRVLFAFCDHTEAKRDYRRYFIYEADIDGSALRQLTGTSRDPMRRWDGRKTVLIEDGDPCYLPDGGIAFVSTRCQSFGRCHNGRYTPALLLHRADGDGGNIRQLSWGEANENDPVVLPDGRMVYTRWDYINRHVTKFHMLWWTRPDGTSQSNFYGADTESPWMITDTTPIPNSDKVAALATGHHSFSTGSIIVIDPSKGENGPEPVTRITPEIAYHEAESMVIRGCYSTPFPLNEEMFLAAYSPQMLPKQGRTPVDDFAIYLVDSLGGRELIYKAKTSCFSPIPIRPQPRPAVLSSSLAEGTGDTGVFSVQDVYMSRNDPEGLIKPGSIKALRINEMVNQPAVWKNQPSLTRHEVAKKLLGTVPVAADGSVTFAAPAGRPLQLQALDENGMAVLTMRTFIYLQPGETKSCVGCHEQRGTAPPQARALTASPVSITPPASAPYEGGYSFMRSVQPVLDRYCIVCHGLDRKSDKLDLLGVQEPPRLPKGWMKSNILQVTRSYNSLLNRPGLVSTARFKAESNQTRPRDYFAAAGRLAPMLLHGHRRLNLSAADIRPIIDWMDLNAQYCGDYSFNRVEDRKIDPAGEKALRAHIRKCFGAQLADQPFAALVNIGRPEASRILNAPLARTAGGWGQLPGGWASKDDPGYKKMAELVNAAIQPRPYHDIDGTCGRTPCVCKSCWVRKFVDGK